MKTYPSVMDQGFSAEWLPHDKSVRNYNSGMIYVGKQLICATRFIDPASHRSEIAIARPERRIYRDHSWNYSAGEDLKLYAMIGRVVLNLPRAHGMEHFEDGRLFEHNGGLYLAYTEGHYFVNPFKSIQKLALLNSKTFQVEKTWTIPFGDNTVTHEKNWQFFSCGGFLYFVYDIARPDSEYFRTLFNDPDMAFHVVVRLNAHMEPDKFIRQPHSIPWKYGRMSGGTPPVYKDGEYISFFHSFIKEEPHKRRYCMAAYKFDAASFKITGYTDPLIWASEADPIIPNPVYPNWLPLVIFPTGALYDQSNWIVSAGVNDSRDAVFAIPHRSLNFHSVR